MDIQPHSEQHSSQLPNADLSSKTGCECSGPGLCTRHGCQKTPHWHWLCQNRPAYFQLWEQGVGPGQTPPESQQPVGEEPGLLRKSINFGRAIARHVADGRRKVSSEVLDARLEICRTCPSCDTDRMVCREKSCGCNLHRKAAWNSEQCPLNQWNAIDMSGA